MESHDNKLAAVDENVSFGLVTISIILVLVLDLLLNGFFLKFIFSFMNKYVQFYVHHSEIVKYIDNMPGHCRFV